jgi:hypothetical protein
MMQQAMAKEKNVYRNNVKWGLGVAVLLLIIGLLFQVISLRYEKSSTVIVANWVDKDWPAIFNNDSTLTSAP